MDHSKVGKAKKLPDKPDSVFPTARLISHESDNSSGRIPKLRICLRPNNQDASLSSPSSQEDDALKSASISNRNSRKNNHRIANSLIDETSIDSNSNDSEGLKNVMISGEDNNRMSLQGLTSQHSKDASFTPNITMTRRKSALAKLQSNNNPNDLSKEIDADLKSIKIENTIHVFEENPCNSVEDSNVKSDEISGNCEAIGNISSSTVECQASSQTKSHFKRCTRRTSLQEKNGKLADLINPDSQLTKVNFKTLINKSTFDSFPASLQFQLTRLLPACDITEDDKGAPRPHPTAFQNEFLAKALSDFPKRIKSGEFSNKLNDTPSDHEIDKWKLDYFEEYWGQSTVDEHSVISKSDTDSVIPTEHSLSVRLKSSSSNRRKRLLPTCPKMVTRKSRSSQIFSNKSVIEGGHKSQSHSINKLIMNQEDSDPSKTHVMLSEDSDPIFSPKFSEDKDDLGGQSSNQAGTPMTLRRQRVPTRRWRQHQEERRRVRDLHRPKHHSGSETCGESGRLDQARSSGITSPSGSSGEAESALSGFSKPSPPTSKPQISNMLTTSPIPVSRSPHSPMPPPTDQLTCRTGSDMVTRVSSGPSSNVGVSGGEPLISPMAPPRKTKTLAAVREKMRALRQMKEQRATPLAQHGCNSDMGVLTSPLSPSTLLSTFEDDSLDQMSASLSSLGHCDSNNSMPHDSIDTSQHFDIGDIRFDQNLLDPTLPGESLTTDKQLPSNLFDAINTAASYSQPISGKLSKIKMTETSAEKKSVDSFQPNLSNTESSLNSDSQLTNDKMMSSSQASKLSSVSANSDEQQKSNLPQQQFVLIPNPKNSSLILCRATPIYSPGVSPETGEAHSFIIHTANGPVALINTQNSNQLSHASVLSAIAKSLSNKDENNSSATSDINSTSGTTSSNSSLATGCHNAPGTIDESVSQKLIEAVRNKIAMSLNNSNNTAASTSTSVTTSASIQPITTVDSVAALQPVMTTSQCQQVVPIVSQPNLHSPKSVTAPVNNSNLKPTVQCQNLQSSVSHILTPTITSTPIVRNGYPLNSTSSQVLVRTLQPSFNIQMASTHVQIQERPPLPPPPPINANIIRPRGFVSPFVSSIQRPSNSPQMLQQILQSSDSSVRQTIPSQFIMSTYPTSSANPLSTVSTPFVGKNPSEQSSVPLQLLFNTNQMTSPVIVGGMPSNTSLHLPITMSAGLQPQYVSNVNATSLQPVVASMSGPLHPAYRPQQNQKPLSDFKTTKRKTKVISKIPAKRRKSLNMNETSTDSDSISTQSMPADNLPIEPTVSVNNLNSIVCTTIAEKSHDSISNVNMTEITSCTELMCNSLTEEKEADSNDFKSEDAEHKSPPTEESEIVPQSEYVPMDDVSSCENVVVPEDTDLKETEKEAPERSENNISKIECEYEDKSVSDAKSTDSDSPSKYTPENNSPVIETPKLTQVESVDCDEHSDNSQSINKESDNIPIVEPSNSCVEELSTSCDVEIDQIPPSTVSAILEQEKTHGECKNKIETSIVTDEKEDIVTERVQINSDSSQNSLDTNTLTVAEEPPKAKFPHEILKDNAYDSDNALDLSMPSESDQPLDLTSKDKSSTLPFSSSLKTSDSKNETKSHLVADILNQHSNSISSDSQSGKPVSSSHSISMLTSANSSV